MVGYVIIFQNRGDEKDMNVRGAWEDGYSGLGIVVTILDDGLEKDHPDLVVNYVSLLRYLVCFINKSVPNQVNGEWI